MKLSENLIRQLIQKSLLLEAKYKLNNLLKFKNTFIEEKNLFDEINNTFIQKGGSQHDLNNPKSAGRFFIDILFECMEEINEIIGANRQRQSGIPDRIMTICNCILFLFAQKEVTSKTVRTGQNFKDYILNFMTHYNKTSYPGTTTAYEKLTYVSNAVNEKSTVSSLDVILRDKNDIKSEKETLYPFGKDAIVDGYKVVAPLSIKSSIFWSRTNWLGEEIVLPDQNDISWCTARLKGGNQFNKYFIGGGTILFYFLPEGDIEGTKKFSIGITKEKYIPENSKLGKISKIKKDELNSEDYEMWEYEQWKQNPSEWKFKLYVDDATAVDFENTHIFENEKNDFSKKETKNKIKRALKISNDNILFQLEKEMLDKDPVDNEKKISVLDIDQFVASTNIDNIAPIDPITGKRNEGDLQIIQTLIEDVLRAYTYNSKLYKVKGFIPDTKILNYIDKNYSYWQKEGLLNDIDYIPFSLRSNKEYILEIIKKNITSESSNVNINYRRLINMISSSLSDDYDILKYVFISNIFKFIDGDPKIIIKNLDLLHNPITRDFSKFIQFFEDSFEIAKKELSDFFNEKNQIIFSNKVSKLILSPDFKLNKKTSNKKLVDLFFTYKCSAFIKLLSYDYCLQNPDLLLKIAEFSKNEIFEKEPSVIDVIPSFLTSKYVKNVPSKDLKFGKHYLVPSELFLNKKFVEKLIAIDPSCLELLIVFGSNLSNDPDILSSYMLNIKNITVIKENISQILFRKNLNNEIVSYEFLKKMCESNIAIFYPIFDWAKYIKEINFESEESSKFTKWLTDEKIKAFKVKSSYEQVQNVSNFVIDFLSNEKNIQELIFSYNEGVNENSVSPATGLGELLFIFNDAVNQNSQIYGALKGTYQKIITDVSFIRKVINVEKIKLKNKSIKEMQFINSVRLLTRCIDSSIKPEIDEYIKSNVIIERKNLCKKLILTESQLRKLINHLL